MEAENHTSNSRQTANSSLPVITLIVLVGLIAALLYIGYEYVADNTNGSEELTNVALDTTQQPLALQNDQEMLMEPEVDTSSQPAPVDLSQAEPPADAVVAEATPEEIAEANGETTNGKPVGDNDKRAEAPKAEKEDKKEEDKPKAEKPKEEKPKAEKPEEKKEVVVEKPKIKPGGVASSHTVGAGETFYGVASRYNMKVSTLKELNPGVSETDVKAGVTTLKVKAMAVHTVGPGDVLRVVAQKYGVSKEALMRANGKTKDLAVRGEKLIIPYPEKK